MMQNTDKHYSSQKILFVQTEIKTAKVLQDSILRALNSYIDRRVTMKVLDESGKYAIGYKYVPDIIINEIGYDLRHGYDQLTCDRVRTMIIARDTIREILIDGVTDNPNTTDYSLMLQDLENTLHIAANNQNSSSNKHNKYQAIKGVNSAGITFFRGLVNNSSEVIGECFKLIAFNRQQLQLSPMKEKKYEVTPYFGRIL